LTHPVKSSILENISFITQKCAGVDNLSDAELRKMSVFPNIILTGSHVKIEIILDKFADVEYKMIVLPVSYPFKHGIERITLNLKDGRTSFLFFPFKEQEYRLLITKDNEVITESSIYALENDLYELNPYKGDFHMHSACSDGLEPPAEVAAQGRKIGLDIMGITDHEQYKPSLEAIEVFNGLIPDFCLCPGEEVHPPNNPVHIVSFGAVSGISTYFETDEYKKEVSDIQSGLDIANEFYDSFQYASTLWVFRKIKQLGGMSIFCHPYWKNRFDGASQEYYISEALTAQILRDRQFDAYEVLGGYGLFEQDSNTLQVSLYNEERLKGQLPIVGVSDAHGCYDELFGWYYTIVFAKSCSFYDIKNAICSCFSVAVEKLPGRKHRVYGPLRLVKYALFLLKEYFPLHDALCAEEGILMMDYIKGDIDAPEKLAKLSGRTTAWRVNCFGR